jgi:hypothetical protein
MSRSVDAAWQLVMQQLQQLATQGAQQQSSTLTSLKLVLGPLEDQQNLPRATWKKLIREHKVFAHVREAGTWFQVS